MDLCQNKSGKNDPSPVFHGFSAPKHIPSINSRSKVDSCDQICKGCQGCHCSTGELPGMLAACRAFDRTA